MLNWFMLRSTHRNEIAEKDKIIAEKDAEITRISNLGRLGGNIRLELLKERDEARAALADANAKIDRMLAPLKAANDRRRREPSLAKRPF